MPAQAHGQQQKPLSRIKQVLRRREHHGQWSDTEKEEPRPKLTRALTSAAAERTEFYFTPAAQAVNQKKRALALGDKARIKNQIAIKLMSEQLSNSEN